MWTRDGRVQVARELCNYRLLKSDENLEKNERNNIVRERRGIFEIPRGKRSIDGYRYPLGTIEV